MNIKHNVNEDDRVNWDVFPDLEPGFYSVIFQDEISYVKERDRDGGDSSSKREYIQIPLKVFEGDRKDAKPTIFIQVTKKDGARNEFGERQLGDILYITNLIETFEKVLRAGESLFDDITFDRMIKGLQSKLPGKVATIKVTKQTYQGKETSQITGIQVYKKGITEETKENKAEKESEGFENDEEFE